jgi:hypothetical protein
MLRKGLFALVVLLGSLAPVLAQGNSMYASYPYNLSGQWYSLGNPRFPTTMQASPFSPYGQYYYYGWGGRQLLTGYGVTPDNYGRMYYYYPYTYPVHQMYGRPGGQ